MKKIVMVIAALLAGIGVILALYFAFFAPVKHVTCDESVPFSECG